MPTKIDFTSVYVSSEDDKHVALELNNHGPTVRGWQSAQSCEYPQDIILKLNKPAVLSKIQVLAHQYLIPEKLELWVNDEDGVESDMIEKRNFDYLGYIMLSDNQSTAFKSRELKSVTVPSKKATYLKLRLSKNHENAYNVHNQVSLIAINILGQEIQPEQKDESNMTSNNNGKISHLVNNPNYISPYDDLAFEMYVDTEVANIIREMDLKKHQAVMDERFEYARKIKVAIEKLTEAGGKLGKYDLEKRHAIDMEDYEKASKKKTQAEIFRKETYHSIGITQLLEENGANPLNDECTDAAPEAIQSVVVQANTEPGLASPPNLLAPTEATGREGAYSPCAPSMYHAPVSPLHHNYHNRPRSPGTASPTNNNLSGTSSSSGGHSRGGSFRRRNKSAGAASKSSFEQYEERTVPALRHSHTNEFLRECQLDVSIEAKMPSKLNDREKKQAALPLLIFGNDLVEKFYSKQYSDKEEGLHRLKEELRNYDNNPIQPANKTARAAIFLLHRALRDKVFSIYSLSAEVIRMFFTEFVPSRVSQAEVARSVDRLLPELLTKSGDPTARIHNMAVHTILSMADCQNVRELHLIPVHLSRPVSSSTHPRLALSRMEMVEQLILNHGISNDKQSGLTCRTLSEFGASGLHHPAEPVRKVAERVLVLVYKVNPRLVRKQLPPDDDITRRNLLYRHLFHEFDKVDIQRKKDMIERNKQIQQSSSSTSAHPECTSPLGMSQAHAYNNCNYGGGTVTKSKSSSNVPYMINDDITTEPANVTQHYVKFAVDCTNSSADNNDERDYIDVANSQVETTNGRYYNEVTENRYYDANDEFVKDHNNKSRKNSNEIEKDGSDLTKETNALQFCANKHIQLSSNGRNSASSTSGVSSPSDSSQREGDKACIFCSNFGNELQTLYTDEQLNSHYWRTCPMLTRCAQCGQVTEVSTLTAHRLVECTNSSEYRQCRRCREAVPLLAYVKHVAETKCIEAKIGYNKCPLCHENIPQEDNSWKEHLMGGNKCPSNPRTNPSQIRSKSAAK